MLKDPEIQITDQIIKVLRSDLDSNYKPWKEYAKSVLRRANCFSVTQIVKEEERLQKEGNRQETKEFEQFYGGD